MLDLEQMLNTAEQEISKLSTMQDLENIKVKYLGKKGLLTEQLKGLGKLSNEERPLAGQKINVVKAKIQDLMNSKKEELLHIVLQEKLANEKIDVSLPSRNSEFGSIHPISLVQMRIKEIFTKFGFSVEDGPEVETEYYNFEALNIPEHHPARAMHDSFYFPNKTLLRTHTSPVQIRLMENAELPIKAIIPGKVYRCDMDMTHSPMFHQVEGLVIDEKTTFADLKGMLKLFLTEFFGREVKLRLRPSYFPFTEPSVEVDVEFEKKDGTTKWLEVLGAGIVHPNVLSSGNIDSEKYTGFAFGMGVERLAMLYYGVTDIREFYSSNLDFLNQFPS